MGKKVLIVDDDRDTVSIISNALKSCDYEVSEAYDTQDGRAKLLEEKPDILLLDVMLEYPTAGFDMVYEIRARENQSRYHQVRDIPIILLSAIDGKSRSSLFSLQCSMMGVNAFMAKPVGMDTLIDKVRELIISSPRFPSSESRIL